MKRVRMKPRKDKIVFSKTAKRVHIKNVINPMRGGIRA